MSDENKKEEEEKTNILGLSDEEVMNMPLPEEPAEEEKQEEEDSNDDATSDEEEEGTDSSDEEDDDTEEEDDADGDDEEDGDDDPDGDGASESLASEGDQGEEDDNDEDSEDTDDQGTIDEKSGNDNESDGKRKKLSLEKPDENVHYEQFYKKITAPFKANGREIQINKPEDIISLMQMGANYNQKMRAIKPHLKFIKMLDNNKLLDESKISYLIDLYKGDKDAITKLIKDSGVDPLNVDVEKDSKYKETKAYNVSDKEVELDQVLDSIQHTDSYQETIDIISNKWDDPSKRIILENPNVIKIINDQIGNGIYDQIMKVVERERVLGNLDGYSDIAAYQNVGEYMQENNMFDGQSSQSSEKKPADDKPAPKSKKPDPKLKKRKLAAGGSKSTPSKKKKQDYDPLALSDEEFEKLSANDYLS